jgi:hypothetical protein
VRKREFNSIRRFIRYGEGRGSGLVRPLRVPFLREEQEAKGFRATDDHFVAVDHDSSGALVGHVSLFNMIHNEIILSRTNPEILFSGLIPAGRRFSWKERKIDTLVVVAHDNMVQPPSVLAERWRRKR